MLNGKSILICYRDALCHDYLCWAGLNQRIAWFGTSESLHTSLIFLSEVIQSDYQGIPGIEVWSFFLYCKKLKGAQGREGRHAATFMKLF